jgi:hypothetical protein
MIGRSVISQFWSVLHKTTQLLEKLYSRILAKLLKHGNQVKILEEAVLSLLLVNIGQITIFELETTQIFHI